MLQEADVIAQPQTIDVPADAPQLPVERDWRERVFPGHITNSADLDRWLRARLGWGISLFLVCVGVWWRVVGVAAHSLSGKILSLAMVLTIFGLLAIGLRIRGSIIAVRMRVLLFGFPNLNFLPSKEEVQSFVRLVGGMRKPDPVGLFSRAGDSFRVILRASGDGRTDYLVEVPQWFVPTVEKAYRGVEFRRVSE